MIKIGQMIKEKMEWCRGHLDLVGSVLLLPFAILIGILLACRGGKPAFEGGNVSLRYDPDQWTLRCYSSAEYPVFELKQKDVTITFLTVRGDRYTMENFRQGIVGLDIMHEGGRTAREVEAWSKGPVSCYVDAVSGGKKGKGDSVIICYGRKKGKQMVLAKAEIPAKNSEDENEERKQEVMEVLDSMRLSGKSGIEGLEEQETLIQFYNIVSRIVKYSTSANLARREGKRVPEGAGELISDEEAASLEYVQKYMVDDRFYSKAEFPVYAPAGSDDTDWLLYYVGHGIHFSASVDNGGTRYYLYQGFESMAMGEAEDWQEKDYYLDVRVGKIQTNGEDRYLLVSAKQQDKGRTYVVKEFSYLDVQSERIGVRWQLELDGRYVDENTDLIIDELAKCYGINLDKLKISNP